MRSRFRQGRAFQVALGLAAWAAGAMAFAADSPIVWDADLAQPGDRAAYERQLREIVRDARARVVSGLGMERWEPPTVRVHSRAGFEREFGKDAVHVDATRFVGEVVHVNGGARLDDRFAGLIVHEMAHAALDARGTARTLPRWLDEGLAERLSWKRRGMDDLAPNQVAELKQAAERRELVPLPATGDLSRLGYLRAYAAVLFLESKVGRDRMLALVRATLGGEPYDRALQREVGGSQADLEREFAAWVGRR